MSDNPKESTSWRPTGSECTIPGDNTSCWKRLKALTALTWPTLAEQVERRILVAWLNPSNSGNVFDTDVFDAACDVAGISPKSSEQFLLPAYVAAELAWENVLALSWRETIGEPRPTLGGADGHDSWREERRRQGRDWWQTVMNELEALLRMEVLYSFELPELTTCRDYYQAMRHDIMKGPFDSLAAVGASIYLEPRLPGTGLGMDRQTLFVMEALSFAVNASVAAVNDHQSQDEQQVKTVLSRLSVLWWLLKGYVFAIASNGLGTPLSGTLIDHEDVWEGAKTALIAGRDTLNAGREDGVKPVAFVTHGSSLSENIVNTTVDELIERMERCLDEARRDWELQKTFC